SAFPQKKPAPSRGNGWPNRQAPCPLAQLVSEQHASTHRPEVQRPDRQSQSDEQLSHAFAAPPGARPISDASRQKLPPEAEGAQQTNPPASPPAPGVQEAGEPRRPPPPPNGLGSKQNSPG